MHLKLYWRLVETVGHTHEQMARNIMSHWLQCNEIAPTVAFTRPTNGRQRERADMCNLYG